MALVPCIGKHYVQQDKHYLVINGKSAYARLISYLKYTMKLAKI